MNVEFLVNEESRFFLYAVSVRIM